MPKKVAIVLFNLGGPDNLDAVRPFLFNLFYDKAILRLPNPFRFLLAKLISTRRYKFTQEIYKHIGNRSPLLEETKAQAEALDALLASESNERIYKSFICMRYWHPFAEESLKNISQYQPDQIILLPLYPQFSSTTTLSSFEDFLSVMKGMNINVPVQTIGCYPIQSDLIEAHVALIKKYIDKVEDKSNIRLLFSAHGLPKRIVEDGDPYAWQVSQTVDAIIEKLAIKDLDYCICYQSKVGPIEWIGPSTEDEIIRAGKDKAAIVLIPIAFVSEHSETLVELDIEYKEFAEEHHVQTYVRVPTLKTQSEFIKALASMCHKVLEGKKKEESVYAWCNQHKCSQDFKYCYCKIHIAE